MRVLLCPDKFAGTLSAPEVAAAVAAGWRAVAAGDELLIAAARRRRPGLRRGARRGARRPAGAGADRRPAGPPGRPARSCSPPTARPPTWRAPRRAACTCSPPAERDPKTTTSYGLGAAGRRRGRGRRPRGRDRAGRLRPPTTAAPACSPRSASTPLDAGRRTRCRTAGRRSPRSTRSDGAPRLRGVRLVAATDVDNPLLGLHGASNVFGPQKGADRGRRAAARRRAGALRRRAGAGPARLPAGPRRAARRRRGRRPRRGAPRPRRPAASRASAWSPGLTGLDARAGRPPTW